MYKWMPWAVWSDENMAQLMKDCGFGSDIDETGDSADINNDIVLIVMTAVRN